jgi:hypothetical protein
MSQPDPPEGDLGDRVDRLETGQGRIEAKIDQLIGGTGPTTTASDGDQPGGRPSDVAEQVRMELEARDRKAAEKAEKDAEKNERQTIRERLAKLTEAPPKQPQPRRQRFMWGER